MKITQVEAIHLRLPRVQDIGDGTQEVLVIRVQTDEGLTGFGEVASAASVAKSVIEAPMSASHRHGLAAVLVGADPLDPDGCWDRMYDASRWYGRRGVAIHALSGVDVALWDIVGKARGMPISHVWGRRRDRVRAYASALFPETTAETAAIVERLVETGFTAVKFGYGSFGRDRRHDLALMAAIAEATNGRMDVMVDVGRAWSVGEAVDRGRELFERFGIVWLEEPIDEDDLEGYGVLCRATDGRIAAGETEATLPAFAALADRGVGVLQPDVGRAGGLTTCRQVGEMAADRDIWCVPHCFGTGITVAASVQWMATARQAQYCEYPFGPSPLLTRLVPNLPRPVDGWVTPSERPGLGIEVDEEVLERYRVH